MNLIGEPWIPILDKDSSAGQVGLQELFERAHEIRDLALQPPQRIAVTRLILCIIQAALEGPRDESDWRACREQIVPESLKYLDARTDRFELFGARPFLQVPNLEPTDNATLDKLDFGLSSGNNATLFDHAGSPQGRELSPQWIALNLLTYQCFSPGGTIGETLWSGRRTGRHSEHAPCVEGSALHAILRKADLLSTIHFNLVPITRMPCEIGIPVWDIPVERLDSAAGISSTYLSRLVPLSRAISIRGRQKCTLANGFAYPKLPISRDSTATVILRRKDSKEYESYLRVDLAKHPWREAPGVLAVRSAGNIGGPLALRNLDANFDQGVVDVWLGGLAADKGKVLDTVEWIFSVPTGLLGDHKMAVYEGGISLAEEGEKALKWAIKEYSQAMRATKSDVVKGYRRQAVQTYWTTLDSVCNTLVEAACSDEASLNKWGRIVRGAMTSSYTVACSHTTPRQIQAFAMGQRRLVLRY